MGPENWKPDNWWSGFGVWKPPAESPYRGFECFGGPLDGEVVTATQLALWAGTTPRSGSYTAPLSPIANMRWIWKAYE